MKQGVAAFTLIELLIVIAIIGILTGLAAISYTTVEQRGRDSQRKNDLNQIKISLSTYYNAQVPQQYPASSTDPTPALIVIDGSIDALSTALTPTYLKTMPLDPVNTAPNVYKYQSYVNDGQQTDYKLFATLENKGDKNGWGSPPGSGWVTDGYVVQNN
ncbi:type II secretion system GspH family protein [Patescibacteria group bacterium]|nr:type II secretion system GspH family protein [Patescibacteria group bacterium]